jgi:hypothetical protein
MDLSTKDTNQLENVRADELVGTNPSFDNPLIGESGEMKNFKIFVSWMFVYDECKKKFRDEHTLIWNEMCQTNQHINWLDYYKDVLIKDIRDIKLKKLLK